MATPQAPTEAEIRAMINPAFTDDGPLFQAELICLSDAFGAFNGLLDDLYAVDDFRPSERDALDATSYDEIERIRIRAIAELREAMVTAGLRFAADHPHAPRKVQS